MKSYPHLVRWLAASATAAIFLVIVFVGGLAGTSSRTADEGGKAVAATDASWPMYGGSPTRNMVNTHAKGLPVKWDVDEKQNIVWSADLGSKAYGGPVVVDGKVYVGTNNQKPRDPKDRDKAGRPVDKGVLMSFDAAKGEFLWQIAFGKLAAGRVVDWPQEGLCSTPLIEGDKLYFTSNRCELVCATTDGKTQWKLDMIKQLGVFPHNITAASPVLIGNRLYLVTANGVDEGHINVPAPKAPSWLCVDKSNGKVIWQNNTPSAKLLEVPKEGDQKSFFKRLVNRGELLQHGQWSNPAYATINGQAQVIFPGGDGWIYALEPDEGKLIWKFDCNPKDAAYELGGKGTRSDFIATPVVYDNKVYIGVGQDPEHEIGVGHLWCIDMTKKGDVSPELVTDNSMFPPKTKPNPESAKVWHYGGSAAGKKLGRNFYFGRTMSTCAVHDGLVYAAELAGYLHCLDAKTGEVYWVHDLRGKTWSSPYWVDGKIYLGNDNGKVTVFAHGKQKKVLAENEMDTPVRATPVAVGNTLYVMTENKLFAIREKQ